MREQNKVQTKHLKLNIGLQQEKVSTRWRDILHIRHLVHKRIANDQKQWRTQQHLVKKHLHYNAKFKLKHRKN